MTQEQREKLVAETKKAEEAAAAEATKKQEAEDEQLIARAKKLGIPVDEYIKKPEENNPPLPKGSEKKTENFDMEALGKVVGSAVVDAIKATTKKEEQDTNKPAEPIYG